LFITFGYSYFISMQTHSQTLPPQEETVLILQRYNVAQAHNLVYTYEELRDLGIQPEFLLALLEVFEDQQSFKAETFDRFSLEAIVDYLRKTHAYYLKKKLLEIEQSIHLLVKAYPSAHPLLLLLHNFYAEYKSHLVKHIEIEERELMPYIVQLERHSLTKEPMNVTPSVTIQQFVSQHHDTEQDLEEVRKTILSYSPPAGNQTLYRILLSQLQVFEKDLAVHALMEDDVLLPRALALEKKLSN
jgi:regulator of cell morphogenesis and NO signaling